MSRKVCKNSKLFSLHRWAKKNYFKTQLDESYKHEIYDGKEGDKPWY